MGTSRRTAGSPGTAWSLDEFAEKPDLATATRFVASGQHFWNSGMFMFKASAYLAELAIHHSAILEACKAAVAEGKADLEFIRLGTPAFENCPSDSIDYAVMEKTSKAMVVPLDAGWSDVGSWKALWELGEKDDAGNSCRGNVLALDTRNSYVRSDSRLLAVIGVEDVIVVETPDAVLVANKGCLDGLRGVTAQLGKAGRPEALHHRIMSPPLGHL